MIYLKAYQAYQQQHYDQCLKLLQEIKQNDTKKLDLQAQVYFQKKEYQKAYDIYQELISKGGEYSDERRENLLAVIVCAQLEQPGVLKTNNKIPNQEDIIGQVELLNLKDDTVYDVNTKLEPTKRTKKHKKRKIRLPKQFDPVAGPDPERWLPRRDRKGNAHKQKKRRGPRGPYVKGKSRVK